MTSLRDRLRQAGLKATRCRMGVLSALAALGGHHSADEIHKALAERGERLPRGSIFKVVGDLCRTGVLTVTDVGPGRTLYEVADVWHHHFVCRRCRNIWDVPCQTGNKPCLLPDPSIPAVIDEAQVIFRGVCHNCLEQTGAEAGAVETGYT